MLKTYIVEDNEVIRDSLIATLEELTPVKVVGTSDNEITATQWLSDRHAPTDLVIVDMFLRDGTGLGVLRYAQSQHYHPVFVVLSNYATADMRRKCLEAGALRVFDKSQEIDELMVYCNALAQEEASGVR